MRHAQKQCIQVHEIKSAAIELPRMMSHWCVCVFVSHSHFYSGVVIYSIQGKHTRASIWKAGQTVMLFEFMNCEFSFLSNGWMRLLLGFLVFTKWNLHMPVWQVYHSYSSHISCCWQLCWMILFEVSTFYVWLWLLSVTVWHTLTEHVSVCASLLNAYLRCFFCCKRTSFAFSVHCDNHTQNTRERWDGGERCEFCSKCMGNYKCFEFPQIMFQKIYNYSHANKFEDNSIHTMSRMH